MTRAAGVIARRHGCRRHDPAVVGPEPWRAERPASRTPNARSARAGATLRAPARGLPLRPDARPTAPPSRPRCARTVSGCAGYVSRRSRPQRRLGPQASAAGAREPPPTAGRSRGGEGCSAGGATGAGWRRTADAVAQQAQGAGPGDGGGGSTGAGGTWVIGRKSNGSRYPCGSSTSPNAEVDVRHGQLGDAARADAADLLPFGHRCAARHRERAEMDSVTETPCAVSSDSVLPPDGHGSREGHRGINRRQDGRARGEPIEMPRCCPGALGSARRRRRAGGRGPARATTRRRRGGSASANSSRMSGAESGVSLSVLQTMAQGTRPVCRCQICLQTTTR